MNFTSKQIDARHLFNDREQNFFNLSSKKRRTDSCVAGHSATPIRAPFGICN